MRVSALVLGLVAAIGCSRSRRSLDAASSGDASAVDGIGQTSAQPVDAQGHTPLHLAAITGNVSAASKLIAAGAPLEIFDKDLRTPLCEAAKHGQRDVAAALLDAKANAEAQCRGLGLTPLHIAAGADASEVVKLLIERGANVNSLNVWHQTPLHQTAMEAPSGVGPAKLLILAHAELEVHDNRDYTPLLAGVGRGQADFVRVLLEAGANPNATLAAGSRSIDVAMAKNHPELVPLLREHGAVPSDRSATKTPP
jgi:ankyrin repeat protein